MAKSDEWKRLREALKVRRGHLIAPEDRYTPDESDWPGYMQRDRLDGCMQILECVIGGGTVRNIPHLILEDKDGLQAMLKKLGFPYHRIKEGDVEKEGWNIKRQHIGHIRVPAQKILNGCHVSAETARKNPLFSEAGGVANDLNQHVTAIAQELHNEGINIALRQL